MLDPIVTSFEGRAPLYSPFTTIVGQRHNIVQLPAIIFEPPIKTASPAYTNNVHITSLFQLRTSGNGNPYFPGIEGKKHHDIFRWEEHG
jgi:hypothetical protein